MVAETAHIVELPPKSRRHAAAVRAVPFSVMKSPFLNVETDVLDGRFVFASELGDVIEVDVGDRAPFPRQPVATPAVSRDMTTVAVAPSSDRYIPSPRGGAARDCFTASVRGWAVPAGSPL